MKATALNVCWSCKRADRTLFRLRDENGFKTKDYICVFCRDTLGLNDPPIGNSSKIYFPKVKSKEEMELEEKIAASAPV